MLDVDLGLVVVDLEDHESVGSLHSEGSELMDALVSNADTA